MAMFSASVELLVNTTWSARLHPKSFASLARVLYTARAASSALPWAPREAFPMVVMACTTASSTC